MSTLGRVSRFRPVRASGLVAVLLASVTTNAWAGPPLITNDPDTPGAGAWEINVAAAGLHVGDAWDIDAPDVDINRGVGDRVQLSLHAPWSHRDTHGNWMAGGGAAEFGVRWRFLDQLESGVSVARSQTAGTGIGKRRIRTPAAGVKQLRSRGGRHGDRTPLHYQ